MLRNILGLAACGLLATAASAQQPTHKSSTIPASHPVPVVASQHAQVPATVVTRKAAATTVRTERKESAATERAERKEAHADSVQARKVHHASKAGKSHRKGMKHASKPDSSARKGS